MKKSTKMLSVLLLATFSLSSCYVNKMNIGAGAPDSKVKIKKWNHYLIEGLIPVGIADPQAMAGAAKDYTIIVKHTFLDYVLTFVTGGIYSPTITIVKK
jgi:predicted small secreted protein